MRMNMKIIAISMALAVFTGCSTVESRMQNRESYRSAQIKLIQEQSKTASMAAQAASAERVAMWNALAEAVKVAPESASHMAIVAAVASTGDNRGQSSVPNMVQLNRENVDETSALDVVKVITPGLIGGLTQVGISAIANETTRASINANKTIRVQEIQTDGQIWPVLGAAVSGNAYVPADATDDTATDDVTTPSETTPEDVVDPSDDVVDPSEDVDDTESTPAIDCSQPSFSPVSPEYAAACQ